MVFPNRETKARHVELFNVRGLYVKFMTQGTNLHLKLVLCPDSVDIKDPLFFPAVWSGGSRKTTRVQSCLLPEILWKAAPPCHYRVPPDL